MASLPTTVHIKGSGKTKRVFVEVPAKRLEELADVLGMYNPAFLESLERAEADVKAGRVKRLRSIKDLA